MIKKIIPHYVKVKIHLIKNGVNDLLNGYFFSYAKSRSEAINFINALEIKQEIKLNDTTISKKQNLLIATKFIESIQIYPNEIFSFWKAVGNPSKKRGFVESRSLINGKLVPSVGGGLCQLSGLIYYSCLYANLEILERHNHSADIYTDETRFTPLGSDATVVYGYKDLKIKNTLAKPVKFTFLLSDKELIIRLNCTEQIKKNAVEFDQKAINEKEIEVVTLVNQKIKDKSVYKSYI
jgi:vancomycin resistance protein VanW